MFKVVRDFVEKPLFFVMCDESCSNYVAVPFEPAQDEDGLQAAFASSLIQSGWKITLARHICPTHMKKLADEGRMVIIPHFASAARKN